MADTTGGSAERSSKPETRPGARPDEQFTRLYTTVLLWSFAATVLIALCLGLLVYWAVREGSSPPVAEIVIGLGSLGAFFSSLIRLYSYNDLPNVFLQDGLKGLANGAVIVYSMVPPVVGAISAIILYFIFAGGLLEGGAFFPEFACNAPPVGDAAGKCDDFFKVVDHYGPKSEPDYFKTFVWGFIAGFAERFVPDTLRSFVKQQTATGGKPSTR